MAESQSSENETWRWLSVSEESLLLHSDLQHLVGHIPLPAGIGESVMEEDYGLPVLDGKTPEELVEIITKECNVHSTTYASLIEYRSNALKVLWNALSQSGQKEKEKKQEESSSSGGGAKSSSKGEGFASRVSLVLIFPVLKSLCKIDPGLSQETAGLLLESLRACEPLSLSSEPNDCITGLENILSTWIYSARDDSNMEDNVRDKQLQIASSALVALAVAVGTGSLLLRTVHTLQSLESRCPNLSLVVPTVLHKLLQQHIVSDEPSALTVDTHLMCWGFESQEEATASDDSCSRSIVFDGDFLYVANGKELLKLGTGLNGTLRGCIYNKCEIEKGWMVYVDKCDKLLYHKLSSDGKQDQSFFTLLDRTTLKEVASIDTRHTIPIESHTTLFVTSDGQLVYWVYVLKNQDIIHPHTGEKTKQHLVYLQVMMIKEHEPSQYSLVDHKDRILLTKPAADEARNSTDAVKGYMRSSSTYSLSALLSSKDDPATSCGLGLKQVQFGTAYCTGSSLVIIIAPPPNTGNRSLFGVSSSYYKPISVSLSYSLSNGSLVHRNELVTSAKLHCGLSKGNIQSFAVCYDYVNHCLWSVTDEWIDLWTCVGKVKPAAHILAQRMGKSSLNDLIPKPPVSDTTPLSEAVMLLLCHSGLESCRLTPGKDFTVPVSHSLNLSFLENCCSILEYSLNNDLHDNCLSIIITLQAVLPGFLETKKDTMLVYMNKIRSCILRLIENRHKSHTLYTEVRKLICHNCESLYFENDEEASRFLSLLTSNTELSVLADGVLTEMATKIRGMCKMSPSVLRLLPLIGNNLEQATLTCLAGLGDNTESTLVQPVFPPTLQCASSLLNLCLRCLSNTLNNSETNQDIIDKMRIQAEECTTTLIDVCARLKVFESCGKILDHLLSMTPKLITPPNQDAGSSGEGGVASEGDLNDENKNRSATLLCSIEKVCKGSVLGGLLPSLLAVLGDRNVCSEQLAVGLLGHLSQLGRQSAEICNVLYKDHKKVIIPAPWASGRQVETTHPVRDNYKFKETVSFPGAKQLYLKFDLRCSSQYDYDKVIVYAGDNVSAPKVAEYGGNTQGFGSRSVLGKGWPKDLVKVNGDKVTFSFEMKSGREHSTPDKAMWGFACTVRPQEVSDETNSSSLGFPFLLDLYLSISSVSCSLIGQLFNGAPPTEDEKKCRAIMNSSLLQRCVWNDESSIESPVLRKDGGTLANKIRVLVAKPHPPFRASIKEILRVNALESAILFACLKHHNLESLIAGAIDSEIEDNRQLLEDIFTHVNGLERRLQVLAELEAKWWTDVEDIATGDTVISQAFYHDFMYQESLSKSFELLCGLMEVDHTITTAKDLESVMENDIKYFKEKNTKRQTKVSKLVESIIDRSKLLLQVDITKQSTTSTDSLSTSPGFSRSLSLPAHRHDNYQIKRQKSDTSGTSSSNLLVDTPTSDKGEMSLLSELFQFIGTKPGEVVSTSSFIAAASQQRTRATNRIQALESIQTLLTSQQLGTTVEHILASVGVVLKNGPHITDIVCSGLVPEVRDAFADVMHAVVELASHQPVSCINTIALLSIIPYTHEEETCLVRSGLVKLLDRLCSLSNLPAGCNIGKVENEEDSEDSEALHRVTALAWAAFQVLAERCVSWEARTMGVLSSGLAQQVSQLLTNHLSRAMDTLVTSESGTSESLQDALSMLLGLARSHMGRTILSQPVCVSKLLLLLTDQRPSPKLVLIALQLCRIALPLMSIADCSQVSIPPNPTFSESLQSDNLASNIITLLMAKLAEYLIPSLSQPLSTKHAQQDDASKSTNTPNEEDTPTQPHPQNDEFDESGQASVYIHRRTDETADELLQRLLNQDPRQSSLNIDSILNNDGKAEIYSDTYKSCLRRSLRWANMGFIVSIEPPVSGASGRGPSGTESDMKKSKAESTCKRKNLELLKTDPPRPFLSGTVAYSLAAEVIGLLNGLLADPDAAQVWKKAIQNVLYSSLQTIPTLVPQLERYCNKVLVAVRDCVAPPKPDKYLSMACLANATFAALGGFKENIRPNIEVQVLGEGIKDCYGSVISISERRGVANVQFNDDGNCFGSNHTLEVPLTRLRPPEIGSLSLGQLGLITTLCDAIVAIVKTDGLMVTNPHSGMDASLSSMGVCRMFAELRSRAFLCLSHHVEDDEVNKELLSNCSIDEFMKQAEKCPSGERLSVIETHCLGLRMLYRDCARPPAPKIEKPRYERKKFHFDLTRSWPPVRSCSFSHFLTSVVYQGQTTSTGSGGNDEVLDRPKGAFVMTTGPIPRQAPSFYWEVELNQIESGSNCPHFTMGYCPNVKKVEDTESWFYPENTCLLRSSGRGCQVIGEDRMKWKKINLDTPLKVGDTMGCGWIRGDGPDKKGQVYFTVNGTHIQQMFNDVPSNMYPFVHLQKKGMRIKANFGDKPFAYSEGHAHRNAADVPEGESLEEIVALFKELPFHPWDDEEDEEVVPQQQATPTPVPSSGTDSQTVPEEPKHEPLSVSKPTKNLEVPKPAKDCSYKNNSSSLYPLVDSFDTRLETGPLIRPGGGNKEEEDEECEGRGTHAEEDLHALLVKAWETKVFPKIQRRFRNDLERKSGLEQIRGALQLGMESIAQETVEFLYEENGGLPKDLYFPTIDDVKADLEKFTVNKIKKGSAVVIHKEFPYARCGVRSMQKTQGLTGVALSVDQQNELVQVECYIPSEGALVRFWYPVMYLEKPPKGYRKPSALRGAESVNILVHRELLNCELLLSSMYCRASLVALHAPHVTRPSSISVPSFLSLVANHAFSQPSVEGMCHSTSPILSPSLTSCLSTAISSPYDIFYSRPDLVEDICHTLLNDPPKDIVYIISEICNQLVSSEGCGHREFPIPESRETTDVCCTDGAFVMVSTFNEKANANSESSVYKYPWCKVFMYRGGQGKAGQMPLQEVIRYPNTLVQPTTVQYCGPPYPSYILPTNRIHLQLGGCSPVPSKLVSVVGVSKHLPLVMTLADLLSRKIYTLRKSSNLEMLCTSLSHCIVSLIKTLCRLDFPPVLKQKIYQTLSNSLWTLTFVQSVESCNLPAIPSDFLSAITQEIEQLYDSFCDAHTYTPTSKGTPFPPPGSLAAGESDLFSIYFQTLLELVLSAQHYTALYHTTTPTPTTPTMVSPDGKKSTKKDQSDSPKKSSWLVYIKRIVNLLQRLVEGRPINREFYNLFRKSLPIKPESKLLVITGINPELEKQAVLDIITKISNGYGGIVSDGVFMPSVERKVTVNTNNNKSGVTPSDDTDDTDKPGVTPSDDADKPVTTPSDDTGTTPSDDTDKPGTTPSDDATTVIKCFVRNGAVIELNNSEKTSSLRGSILYDSKLLGEISVSIVNHDLHCGEDKNANDLIQEYLHFKLFNGKNLKDKIKSVLSKIYNMACYDGNKVERNTIENKNVGESYLRLLLLKIVGDRDLRKILGTLCEGKKGLEVIGETKLIEWVEKEARKDVRAVWIGLFAAGIDFNCIRRGFLPSDACLFSPDLAKDHALTLHIDLLSRKLGILSKNLQPWDVTLSEVDLTSPIMIPLQNESLDSVILRFLHLKQFSRQFSWLLSIIDLSSTHPASLGTFLSHISEFIFYDTKVTFLHSVLNSTATRIVDFAPPEIKMDPLEMIEGISATVSGTQFCQAARQMLSIPSPQLCVTLASGGDPMYAFNVKLAGEEVQGTSGSFRHFLWQVVRELQSPLLPILTLCPSHSVGTNKGKYILLPGTMTYAEEKMLEFFGQLLGVACRADVPVAIDLLDCFWKNLKGEPLSVKDLEEADIFTYSLTQRIIDAEDETVFYDILSGIFQTHEIDEPRVYKFVYTNMKGCTVEVCKGGIDKDLNFANRVEFAQCVRTMRLRELSCTDRSLAIRCGMASIVSLQLLRVLTAADLNLRICGLPDIDLDYLKRHTNYYVGLMESDRHIQYFWNTLESLSQEELRKFIKFACNQERIPFGEPCRNEDKSETEVNVPPFPMKIAPPDGSDPPDTRYIRAETCMFLIKLPQYSTQELMTERLKYAINCREDPLIG